MEMEPIKQQAKLPIHSSMETEHGKACNESTPSEKINDLCLYPVFPESSGEGLPYAPENWPNLGDIWTWKVGKRFTGDGHFIDRYLYLPPSFRSTEYSVGNARMFKSKKQVERYIQEKFPGRDVDEFFSLFSWKIPAESVSVSNDDNSATLPSPLNLHVALPHHKQEECPHETDVMEVRNFETPSKPESKSLNVLSISSDYEAERQKLDAEINQVLRNLRKSQEAEYKLAEEKLTAQRIIVQNLYKQLDNERSALAQQTSNPSSVLPVTLFDKMDEVKREVEKLRDMEVVGNGFGKTSTNIIKEYYGLIPEV